MQARMSHPVMIHPDAMKALMALGEAVKNKGISKSMLELTHLRASQINGCSVCVQMHAEALTKAGETTERIIAVSAWREAPYFTDAERAALALTEALTRTSDKEDPVSDVIWADARKHFDEPALAALLLSIAQINLWNRLNIATRQVAGSHKR